MLNSTKTWQEKFDEIKIVKANDFGCNEKDKEAMVKLLNDLLIPYKEATKQFISDLRKRDMEALIRILNEEKFIQVVNFNDETTFDRKGYRVGFIAGVNANQAIDKSKQLIQDYYENN